LAEKAPRGGIVKARAVLQPPPAKKEVLAEVEYVTTEYPTGMADQDLRVTHSM